MYTFLTIDPGEGYMKNTHVILGGILMIALLCSVGTVSGLDGNSPGVLDTGDISDDIAPYNGSVGADNPMHGLKLAMEDLDETFTFNDTRRLEKQVDHAGIRISEIRKELILNRTESANRALELYRQKLNLTEMSLMQFASDPATLLHTQKMIARHEMVLANLSLVFPDNSGLGRAFNKSLLLEQKFEQKTEIRFSRLNEKNNKTIFRAMKLDIGKQNKIPDDAEISVEIPDQDKNKIRDKEKDQKDVIPVTGTITPQAENRNKTTPVTKKSPEENGSSRDKNKNG